MARKYIGRYRPKPEVGPATNRQTIIQPLPCSFTVLGPFRQTKAYQKVAWDVSGRGPWGGVHRDRKVVVLERDIERSMKAVI